MSKIILHKHTECHYKLEMEEGQAWELREFLSAYATGFRFHPKYKMRIWDGIVRFFTPKDYLLPVGLFSEFVSFCKSNSYEYEFSYDVKSEYDDIRSDQFIEFANYIEENMKFKFRDYQILSAYKAIKYKKGILQLATGAGKSSVMYLMVRYMLSKYPDKKILIVVPSITLVNQLYSDFKDYGWKSIDKNVSLLGGGARLSEGVLNTNVLISTWQSIYQKKQKFFRDFNSLIVDETHTMKSNSLREIGNKCVNAEYRIGLTGTLPIEKSDVWAIMSGLGPVLYELKSKELIDQGVLSEIQIINLLLEYPHSFIKKNYKRDYANEVDAIINFEPRMLLFDKIFSYISEGENTLVLAHRISHIEQIIGYISKNFPKKKVYEIHGKISAKEREYIRQLMDREKDIVLVGSFATLSTGVNVKRIHNVIFASSYKSKIKILQSIGRGLRTHADKNGVKIWDCVDSLLYKKKKLQLSDKYIFDEDDIESDDVHINHVYKHWIQRLKYYKEQGFNFINKRVKLNETIEK